MQKLSLVFFVVALGACSSKPVQPEPIPQPVQTKSPKPADSSPQLKTIKIDSADETVKVESIDPATVEPVKKEESAPESAQPVATEAIAPQTTETAPPQSAERATHATPVDGVPGDKALGWLKNGNVRFVKTRLRTDGQSSADRARLTQGQKPHTALLACSDSRVPPEIVFDQKLGELFVVRTAGESTDAIDIASLEYAVAHLGVNLVVVMGHTQCGAVKAAMETPKSQSAGSPGLDALVAEIRPRIETVWDGHSPASPQLYKEVTANASGIAKDLITKSEILRSKAQQGTLKIKSAVYHLDSGEVEFQP